VGVFHREDTFPQRRGPKGGCVWILNEGGVLALAGGTWSTGG